MKPRILYNYSKYGVLYTLNEALGACPTGWHLPSNQGWITLENILITNGYNYDGTTMNNLIGKALASNYDWVSSAETGSLGIGLSSKKKCYRLYRPASWQKIE